MINTSLRQAIRPTRPSGAAVVMAITLAALWIVLGIDAALGHPLLRLGIKPREAGGLPGIVASPLLHSDVGQLSALSVPLAVLGWLMLTSGLRYLALVTAAVALASGLVDWLAGPSHQVLLGATGVVLGWLGYLLARAWFGRKVLWMAIAVAVAVVFSGLFDSLMPRFDNHVFWGGNLAAFVVGVLIAAALHRRRRRAGPGPILNR